jgi:trans-aconitate methyltransferase
MSDRQVHWENVYATKDENAVSWFQETPDISLDLVRATGVSASASIIDIGGGASRLVDALLDKGFKTITVLDLSEKALAKSKARLGTKGAHVRWIVADITTWEPSQACDVWHDYAALHFLTDPKDRAAYADRVSSAVRPGVVSAGHRNQPELCLVSFWAGGRASAAR